MANPKKPTAITSEDISIILKAFRLSAGQMAEIVDMEKLKALAGRTMSHEDLCKYTYTTALKAIVFGPDMETWPEGKNGNIERLLMATAYLLEGFMPPEIIEDLPAAPTLEGGIDLFDDVEQPEIEPMYLVQKQATGKQYEIGHDAYGFPAIRSAATGKTAVVPWTFIVDLAIASGIDNG